MVGIVRLELGPLPLRGKESSNPFLLKNFMHVPGLKKNLVSIAMLEDKGYDVVFSEGKAFLRHKTMGKTKKIGV